MFWFHIWFISKPFNSIIDWTLNHIRIDIKIGNVFKSTSNCQNWINSLCFQKFSFLKIAVNYLVTRHSSTFLTTSRQWTTVKEIYFLSRHFVIPNAVGNFFERNKNRRAEFQKRRSTNNRKMYTWFTLYISPL